MPYTYDYPRPAVSADVVVTTQDLTSILLIQRKRDPFAGAWALPGGFMDMDESAADAAIRELKEETCLDVSEVTSDRSLFERRSRPARPRGDGRLFRKSRLQRQRRRG